MSSFRRKRRAAIGGPVGPSDPCHPEEAFVVGSLWLTAVGLGVFSTDGLPIAHTQRFPGLDTSTIAFLPRSTPVVYTGPVRSTLALGGGRTRLILRHSFLWGGIRFVADDAGRQMRPAGVTRR